MIDKCWENTIDSFDADDEQACSARTLASKSSRISLTPKSKRLFLLQFHCAKFHLGTAAPFCRNAVDSVETVMGSARFIF